MSLNYVLSSFNLQNLSVYFLNIERNEAPAECRSGFQTFILILEMSSNLERYFEEWKILGGEQVVFSDVPHGAASQ